MEHVTITIRVHNDNGSYVVTANSLRGRKSDSSCVFHMPPERWQDLEPSLRVLNARSGELSLHDHEKEIRDFGISLFNSLFHDEVRVLYDEKKRDAVRNNKILRLRLNILPPELVILPWEILYDERIYDDGQISGYLCLERKPNIVIIRTIDHVSSKKSLPKKPLRNEVSRPLHILGMVASPTTLPFLDIEKEQYTIQEALQSLIAQQQVQLRWKPGRYAALEEIRLAAEHYDIFHFAGHGLWDEKSERGQLAVEGERRQPRYVPADHWHRFLQSSTKLVVLNACETAFGNRFNSFSNIASSLIKVGFPAVIAMQFKITDTASLKFSKAFYTSLARSESVDEAIIAAREAIYLADEETNPLDWAAPIFFSSSSTPIYLLPPMRSEPPIESKPPIGSEPPIEPKPPVEPKPPIESKPPIDPKSPIESKPPVEPKPPIESKPLLKRSKLVIIGIIMLILLLIGGSVGKYIFSLSSDSSTVAPCTSNDPHPLFIGTDFPTSEPGESGAKNGADLAISENRSLPSGYTLEACDRDDASGNPPLHDPNLGAQNVRTFGSDPRVMGVVGPGNSGVAFSEAPIASSAGLPLISPEVTDPCLTKGQYCNPPNPPEQQVQANTFFRLVGNDIAQATADALLAKSLGISTVCIVDDGEVYGEELALDFAMEFVHDGGSIAVKCEANSLHISDKDTSAQLVGIAQQIATLNPQAVFYGGVAANQPGQLNHLLFQANYKGFFLGGDGIGSDSAFLADAGPNAIKTYATSVGPDTSTINPSFIQKYQAQYHSMPTSRSALGYDAAMVLIQAIKGAIMQHASNLRSAVLNNMEHTSYQGITGNIIFDAPGDNSGDIIFSVYFADFQDEIWRYQPDITKNVNSPAS